MMEQTTKITVYVPKHGITSCIARCERGLPIDGAFLHSLDMGAQIFSFQRIQGLQNEYVPYDSCTRATLRNPSSDALCVALQASSSFCDVVLWDLAHSLKVGRTLVLVEPVRFDDCILKRRYFKDCFEVSERTEGGWHVASFTKQQRTISEGEAGLTRWSFGLPIGEFSPSLVDKLLTDIETLGLEQWEVLLAVSKMPDDAAKVSARIRLLPCGTATITEKKNLIAKHATHENLCIFHDRVDLPANFKSAIERFGDHYALAGFQHLFFDHTRRELERYSDYHVDLSDGRALLDTDDENERGKLYTTSMETRLSFRAQFAEAHPAEYVRKNYLTGTLYLAKRGLWQLVEQNPEIEWNQLEDVEFGDQAMRVFGIPSRINPFAFGFTSRVRAVLLGDHEVVDRRDGTSVIHVLNSYEEETRKGPSTGLDQSLIRARAWALFCEFGLPTHDFATRQHIFYSPMASERDYARYWVRILFHLGVPRSRTRLERLLELFSLAAFGFAYDPGTKQGIINNVINGGFFVDAIVRDNYFIRSLDNVPNLVNRRSFGHSDDVFAQAMRLWRRGGDYIYPYESFEELLGILEGSLGLSR